MRTPLSLHDAVSSATAAKIQAVLFQFVINNRYRFIFLCKDKQKPSSHTFSLTVVQTRFIILSILVIQNQLLANYFQKNGRDVFAV